jgi:hypothetical protein
MLSILTINNGASHLFLQKPTFSNVRVQHSTVHMQTCYLSFSLHTNVKTELQSLKSLQHLFKSLIYIKSSVWPWQLTFLPWYRSPISPPPFLWYPSCPLVSLLWGIERIENHARGPRSGFVLALAFSYHSHYIRSKYRTSPHSCSLSLSSFYVAGELLPTATRGGGNQGPWARLLFNAPPPPPPPPNSILSPKKFCDDIY